jgi:signal transduction histidine kinase
MRDLASGPAAGQTVTMRARLTAAGLRRAAAGAGDRPGEPVGAADLGTATTADPGTATTADLGTATTADPGTATAADPGTAAAADLGTAAAADSARVAAARSRASERLRRQRQQMRPLGWAFIAAVVISAQQGRPALGLAGMRLGITAALVVCAVAAAVGLNPRMAERGAATQVLVIGLLGGGGVALAALQPHGATGLAASLAVWIAAVRLPAGPAAAVGGAVTAALAAAVALTQRPAAQPVIAVTLFCLLLAVTGRFIRRSRESQDQTELLMAQLQDAREAEAAAAALAERGRIAGELHDVLAHALSGLAIQLQAARKLAAAEGASAGLRAAIGRSADLAKEGLTQARQAVGALRGDRIPSVEQLPGLVDVFRRDTGTDVSLVIEGEPRPLPAEAGLALYRGAQEALTNIARYAPGVAAVVTVRYQPSRTVLTVENGASPGPGGPAAGSGQDPGPLTGMGGGHGLAAMRARAERAGGTARSGPHAGGWLVELEVPV